MIAFTLLLGSCLTWGMGDSFRTFGAFEPGAPGTLLWGLSGTESAILNRESCDAIMRFQGHGEAALNSDHHRLRFGLAILSRFSVVLLHCGSTQVCASRCRNSGDSRPAMRGNVRFAIRNSVPLSIGPTKHGVYIVAHDLLSSPSKDGLELHYVYAGVNAVTGAFDDVVATVDLSAPKSREPPRLRLRFVLLPRNSRFVESPAIENR